MNVLRSHLEKIYLETNGAARTWQGPECKVLRRTKRNRDTNGLEFLKLVQSAIERYLIEKTFHSCPPCSPGSFTTQKKSFAELHRLHPQIPSPKTTRCLSLNHKKRRFTIIDLGDENRTLMHEIGCFRSHIRTACLFVMLEWVLVTWHNFAY